MSREETRGILVNVGNSLENVPTKRLEVSLDLDAEIVEDFERFSKIKNKSISEIVRDFITGAVDMSENMYFVQLIDEEQRKETATSKHSE